MEKRFWSKVKLGKQSECWPWLGALLKSGGYGAFRVGGRRGKTVRANRVAWELTFGVIPQGQCVLHRCDNPACCNPVHLFLGTRAENTADMVAKGRLAPVEKTVKRGSKHGGAKLSEEQVLEIRELYAAGGASKAGLARRFGVSEHQIYLIVNRRNWAHI